MPRFNDSRTSDGFRTALDRMKKQEEARLPLYPKVQAENFTAADEGEHFMLCPRCGQPIDCRDLAAALHHEEPGHRRLSLTEATRMVASPALRAALAAGRWAPGSKVTN